MTSALTPAKVPPPGSPAPSPSQSQIKIQNSKFKNPRHRRGNVARLPKELRDRLNRMLDDGFPFAHIARLLAPQAPGLTPAHIGSWMKGGYQDYLHQQHRLELCRPSHEFLSTFLSQCQGTDSYQAAPKLAAALLCETFVDLGPDTIRRALQENPMNAFRLLHALARLLSGGLRCERFLAEKIQPDSPNDGSPPDPKVKGLRPKTFDQINDALSLM